MRRLSLGTLLIGLNVGLVVAAVVGVVVAGSSLLRRLADEQAIARVRLAGSTARLAVELEANHLQTAGHLLAERPDLEQAVEDGNASAAGASLAELRVATGVTVCAVLVDGKVLASSAGGVEWSLLLPPPGGRRAWGLGPAGAGGGLMVAAFARLRAEPRALVATARALDASFARDIAAQAGMPVEIVTAREALAAESDRAPLRGRAIDDGAGVAGRVDAGGIYLSVEPLHAPDGPVAAVLETTLPTADTDASVAGLVHVLLALAVVCGGIAALFSVVVGRRLVAPLADLRRASARIGGGDLTTPIPRQPGAETGELAAAMEEMRGRLFDLTQEARQRRSAAEAVLTGIVEGVFAVDRERRIRYLNPQTAAILGIETEAAVGRFCGDVLNPQGADGVRPCEERCPIVHARFRGGARATERLLLAGGAHRSVVITSAAPPFPEPGGGLEPAGSARQFQVIRDETEVEATRRLRDTVLANITHEFRTPLSAQLASIELLRDRLPDLSPEEAADLIAALERGTLRLTQLIDNLLESVRLDAGQDAIRRQPVALDEVVDQAVALTAPLIELRGQRLDVDLPHPLPALRGDAPRLVQVFVNLLANANKFAPAGSTIRIGGARRDAEIALWVEDEGPGLPDADGSLLFERFMRSPGEEPEESGMGLGLFIVKSIVERHGGRVEARPAGLPGGDERGTRMCVVLPAGDAAAGAAPGGAASGGAA